MTNLCAQYSQVSVAVTGATGFVGGCLARRLLGLGARVSLLVRDPARLDPSLRASCRVVEGDLSNVKQVSAALQDVNYVFHCAANVATWGPWAAYIEANVSGVHTLLDALEGSGASLQRFVHVSTMDVYGFPPEPVDESAPLHAVLYPYGESKRQGDLVVQERCARSGVSYAILRPGNIVGPGSPFVSRIGAALESGWMLAVDGGLAHAGLLDVDNLIDVMLWAGHSPQANQQVYNVRDPWDVCWRDYVNDLRRGMDVKSRVIDLPYAIACALAKTVAAPYSVIGLSQEPFLHPLIVQIFGRTCGHSIEKLVAHGAEVGGVDYVQSLQRSLEWIATENWPIN